DTSTTNASVARSSSRSSIAPPLDALGCDAGSVLLRVLRAEGGMQGGWMHERPPCRQGTSSCNPLDGTRREALVGFLDRIYGVARRREREGETGSEGRQAWGVCDRSSTLRLAEFDRVSSWVQGIETARRPL